MNESTTIKVDRDIINEYKILSAQTNRKRNELINEALIKFLNEFKKG